MIHTMTMDELGLLPNRLGALLADRDWEDASAEVNNAAGFIRSAPAPISPDLAARLMSPLNRNRRYADLVRLTGSLLFTGARSALIARRHAQGLIETSAYAEAESMLNGVLAGRYGDATYEVEEATALLGRLNKQLYIGPADELGAERNPLERAAPAVALDFGIDLAGLFFRLLAQSKRDRVVAGSEAF